MIFISTISVLTLCLWTYIRQGKHKAVKFFGGLGLSLLSGAILVYYGQQFPAIYDSAWLRPFHGVALASLSWVLSLFMALPFVLVDAVGCLIYRWRRRKKKVMPENDDDVTALDKTGPHMSRRTFLKGVTAALPVAAIATSGVGNVVGESYLAVTTHDIVSPLVPDYLDGYKIGQLSDTHMGLFLGPKELQQSIDAAANAGVNRLEITGDLIDELSLLPECKKILLSNFQRFPDGIDFCYGNHEYYRGIGEITAMLADTPIRILRNSNVCVSPGKGAQLQGRQGRDTRPFYIAGADYAFAKGDEAFVAERQEFMAKTLAGIPQGAFTLLLAHHSAFIDEAFARHIPLTLCGHTHGAQVAPIGPIVNAVGFKYLRGMYRQGDSYGYVNRGTGHWLPFRLLCSREVSIFTLHQS